MSWLIDYFDDAEQTDRLVGRSNHVALLATGLFGETGSVLTELKKAARETAAYPSYRNRLVEEIGDLLWYFARLVTVLAPSEVQKLDALAGRALGEPREADAMTEALTLGGAAGALLVTLQQKTDNVAASQLGTIWRALLRVARAVHVDLREAARRNVEKTESRWPPDREYAPLFDDEFGEEEQLPRKTHGGVPAARSWREAGRSVALQRTESRGSPYRQHRRARFLQVPRRIPSRARSVFGMVADPPRPVELQAKEQSACG